MKLGKTVGNNLQSMKARILRPPWALVMMVASLACESVVRAQAFRQGTFGLYNTGVDERGQRLAAGVADPRWKLIERGGHAAGGGPDGVGLSPAAPTVVSDAWAGDNWLASDAASGWVGWPDSQLQPAAGGWYQYEIQCDLTGYDPASVEIKGRWLASDNAVAVRHNGADTTNPGKGGAWRDWVSFTLNKQTVSGGLQPGVNTLRFLTWNNDEGGPDFTPTGPSGLRVEFESAMGQRVLSFANGTAGLFNTGVNDQGQRLAPGTPDPHWRLIERGGHLEEGNPDGTGAGLPANTVPVDAWAGDNWLANSIDSGWVSWPDGASQNQAGGWYQYEIQFDLTAYDASTVEIQGRWLASDNAQDVRVNGQNTTNPNRGGAWRDWVSFTLNSQTVPGGFQPGVNTLRFLAWNNDGGGPAFDPTGPPGLRVEFLGFAGTRKPGFLPGTFGLYATAVDDTNVRLAPGQADPHWRLIERGGRQDPGHPDGVGVGAEPAVACQTLAAENWLANAAESGWMSWPDASLQPRAGGWYLYEIPFDLSGYDTATVEIEGRWLAADNAVAVRLNGADTPNPGKGGAWNEWTPFRIDSSSPGGFRPGVNTLRVLTWNNDGGAPDYTPTGPSGVRVEFTEASGIRWASLIITRQPQSQVAVAGADVTFSVSATGEQPIQYQWQKDGQALPGAIAASLLLKNVQVADGGVYACQVSDVTGESQLSQTATLTVVEGTRVTVAPHTVGLFSTGFGTAGDLEAPGAQDAHFVLVERGGREEGGPDGISVSPPAETIVTTPLGEPESWLANNTTSRWVSWPDAALIPVSGGWYQYETEFDLSDFVAASVEIKGRWLAADNAQDVRLNGQNTPNPNRGGAWNVWVPFTLKNSSAAGGFEAGRNTIRFLSWNNDAGADGGFAPTGPTGLRVEFTEVSGYLINPPPTLAVARKTGGQVEVSWLAPATGYRLHSSPALGAGAHWQDVPGEPAEIDGRLTVSVQPGNQAAFYRLVK